MSSNLRFSAHHASDLYEGFDYAAFWQGAGRSNLDELEHRVTADLLPRSGLRILDAGCGFGRLTDTYVDRFQEVVLLDSARSLLEQARDRWAGRVTLVAADLEALPFGPGAFDAFVLVRVLHHFSDPRPILTGLRRVAAPGARLVFSASNSRNPRRVARYVLGLDDRSPFGPGPVQYGPGTFGWAPRDLERALTGSGFSLRRLRGVGVMDKVAGRAGPLGRVVPRGTVLSRPLGWLRLAPSLFGAAVADGGDDQPNGPLFRCPVCGAGIVEVADGYTCRRCERRYPTRDGILDFRI
jgi:SAM-dependent methyltransferase